MLRSSHFGWALMLSFGVAQLSNAQEPPRLELSPNASVNASNVRYYNQQIADTIAQALRQSAQLHHFDVDVRFQNGTAELSGTVGNQPQRDEVLRIAQGVLGVERVRDRLTVRDSSPIVQTQQQELPPPAPNTFEAPESTTAVAPPSPEGQQYSIPEPQPIFQAPVPMSSVLPPPKMPPYAWPTYAPYNNFSRVGYPQAYPYKSWPFIGPFYPFPKVPLGWRSVKLEWDDGYWWYGRTATKKNWWRLRFW